MNNPNEATVLSYVRKPLDDMIYAPKLANAMHLAVSIDAAPFQPLQHNGAILFATAQHNPDGTLEAKSLRAPCLFVCPDGQFGVVAVRTNPDGEPEYRDRAVLLVYVSDTLTEYAQLAEIQVPCSRGVTSIRCAYDHAAHHYVIEWSDGSDQWYRHTMQDIFVSCLVSTPERVECPLVPSGLEGLSSDAFSEIEGVIPCSAINVPVRAARDVRTRLSTPVSVAVDVPDMLTATTPRDLQKIQATVRYSDGTSQAMRVDWDSSDVDWDATGTHQITGVIRREHVKFPMATGRADPCVRSWNGHFYFIATNDEDDNHTLYMRCADSILGLPQASESLILDSKTYPQAAGLLWAPEFHVIGGELYLFFACTTGEFFHEESHVMKLKHGGDPMNRDDWGEPLLIRREDGSELAQAGSTITLDMTVIENVGPSHSQYYAVWSQRQFQPVDQGAWLWIAELNPDDPTRLQGDPVLLSQPEYGWENNHTFVDEGPFALIRDGMIYLTFSGAAVDATYCVGVLSAQEDCDLLDVSNWSKTNYPILTLQSVPGEYGPGHNAFVTDNDGVVWNSYHARPSIDGPRSSGLRRVHFRHDGFPVLDVTEDREVSRALRKVETTVRIIR